MAGPGEGRIVDGLDPAGHAQLDLARNAELMGWTRRGTQRLDLARNASHDPIKTGIPKAIVIPISMHITFTDLHITLTELHNTLTTLLDKHNRPMVFPGRTHRVRTLTGLHVTLTTHIDMHNRLMVFPPS